MAHDGPHRSEPGHGRTPDFNDDERAHAQLIVRIVGSIVEPLARALAPRTEVVLHDLTRMPGTIAAISGDITGRRIGGPATDLGLRTFSSGWNEHLIGYRTEAGDGLPLRSSSIFFRAHSGRAVACLCLNTDISEVTRAQELLRTLSAIATIDPALHREPHAPEHFPKSVDELALGILTESIAEVGITVAEMKKSHKIEVVKQLRERGFFTIREAIPIAARELGVGRHTIYNYLNEIELHDDTERHPKA